jgi:hypothetical protein
MVKLVTFTPWWNERDKCWEIIRHENGKNPETVQTGILTLAKANKAQDLWRARQRGDA